MAGYMGGKVYATNFCEDQKTLYVTPLVGDEPLLSIEEHVGGVHQVGDLVIVVPNSDGSTARWPTA